jgi:hypothetical protein
MLSIDLSGRGVNLQLFSSKDEAMRWLMAGNSPIR